MAENGKIYEAICGVMEDVGAVKKTDRNDFDKYMYRGIDAVMNALQPAMIKHHVFVTPEVIDQRREDRQSRKGEPLIYSVTTVKYTFYTDDGSSVSALVIGEAMDRGDKSMNKAMSAAFKYACFQTFCIPTEEMIDSEKDSHELAQNEAGQELTKEEGSQVPMASEKQINFLKKLGNESQENRDLIMSRVKAWNQLTKAEATALIGELKK